MQTFEKYTCTTCTTQTMKIIVDKEHYKSLWHCYNLKRKLAGFQVISEAEFNRKITLLKESCNPKKKGTNHLRVITGLVTKETSLPESKANKPQLKPLTYLDSFFDNQSFASVEENLEYMKEKYSLFLPDEQYLISLKSLFMYLIQKLYYGHQCLFCNRPFKSLLAVRTHMIDKGHTSIGIDTEEQEEELEPYYDYSKEKEMENDSCVNKKTILNDTSQQLIHSDDNDDEWENETEDRTIDSSTRQHLLLKQKASPHPFINTLGNLVLPNGTEAVNRYIAYIYRQRKKYSSQNSCVRSLLQEEKHKLAMVQRSIYNLTPERKACLAQTKSFNFRFQRDQMRLGIKTNKLQKNIRRQDKYFL